MIYAFKAEWKDAGIEWYAFDTEEKAKEAMISMGCGGYKITGPVVRALIL